MASMEDEDDGPGPPQSLFFHAPLDSSGVSDSSPNFSNSLLVENKKETPKSPFLSSVVGGGLSLSVEKELVLGQALQRPLTTSFSSKGGDHPRKKFSQSSNSLFVEKKKRPPNPLSFLC